MSFWAYMLHCRGGYFYAGHTDDLERRISQHQSGTVPGFTADHQPVELVWSESFQTREDAKAAERRLKGWSRAKKLALIRGDWGMISELAKKRGSASTSSAKTGEGEAVAVKADLPELVEGLPFSLLPHPDTPPCHVTAVAVRLYSTDGNDALVEFTVVNATELAIPSLAAPSRQDGLWQTTCFELFLRPPGSAEYWEFNFSPSTRWAAYKMSSYRHGMQDHVVDVEPQIVTHRRGGNFILETGVDFGGLPPGPVQFGLSAVIEEHDGTKSYWALAHPPGQPDFHHPTCFAATLPPPNTP